MMRGWNLKKWDSVTCRDCHRDPNPPGADAQEAHKKLKTEGATCIDCHQNLVHEAVPKTDLNASLAAGKMVVMKEEDEGGDEEEDEEDEDGDGSGSEAVESETQSEDGEEEDGDEE